MLFHIHHLYYENLCPEMLRTPVAANLLRILWIIMQLTNVLEITRLLCSVGYGEK